MDDTTLIAFEDEIEKIAVTLATASPRLRHAFARLQGWKGSLEAARSAVKGAPKSMEPFEAAKKLRPAMLEKGRYVEKHFGAPLRAPAFEGKTVQFAKPKPTQTRNIPR